MEYDWMLAVKACVSAAIAAFTAFWGWVGWLCLAWIGLMALDYITGTSAAIKSGSWSSKAAREGLWHKSGEVVVVVLAAIADRVLVIVIAQIPLVGFDFPGAGLLLPLVLTWYCITELGSIAENAAALGAPVPALLLKVLEIAKDKIDDVGDKVIPPEEKETEEKEK